MILSPVLLAKNNVVDCTEWQEEGKVFFCALQRKMVGVKIVENL